MGETKREVFLSAIHAAPDDLTPRLVYADWLDERGDPEAELVRLLCEVRQSGYAEGSAWERLEYLVHDLHEEVGRLGEQDARLLGCDCAGRVLPWFGAARPDDDRPAAAIETARRFAMKQADRGELAAASAEAAAAMRAVRERILAVGEGAESELRRLLAADAAAWAASSAAGEPFRSGWAATAAAEKATRAVRALAAEEDAERRWQLCRALEYRLGFVPPPECP